MGNATKKILKRTLLFLNRHKYFLALSLILILSCVWRFYNYPSRWVFNQDEARDVIIARFAIENRIIPLLGPPSSAGPFNFGPLYYWVVMILSLLFKPMVNGPWFGFTLLSAFAPVLMFLALKKMGGLVIGVIGGLLTAFSSGLVDFSTGMTNPILSGLAVFLLLFSLVSYFNDGKLKYSFLVGFGLGIAINAHLQAGVLVVTIPLTFLLAKFNLKNRFRFLVFSSLSLFVTFIPLIIFDIKNNGMWIKSVVNYLLYGQNKFYIPIRWLTDLRNFWPELFGRVVLGNEKLGLVLAALIAGAFIISLKKRWLNRTLIILFLTFIFQVIAVRYYKGPRLPVYFLFLYPFMIFFTAWAINCIWKVNKYLGLIILGLILIISTKNDLLIIRQSGQSNKVFLIKNTLYNKDNTKYVFYSSGSSYMLSYPLLYLMGRDGKIVKGKDGFALLACDNFLKVVDPCTELEKNRQMKGILIAQDGGYKVYNVSGVDLKTRDDLGFDYLNDQVIFNRLFVNYPNAK